MSSSGPLHGVKAAEEDYWGFRAKGDGSLVDLSLGDAHVATQLC